MCCVTTGKADVTSNPGLPLLQLWQWGGFMIHSLFQNVLFLSGCLAAFLAFLWPKCPPAQFLDLFLPEGNSWSLAQSLGLRLFVLFLSSASCLPRASISTLNFSSYSNNSATLSEKRVEWPLLFSHFSQLFLFFTSLPLFYLQFFQLFSHSSNLFWNRIYKGEREKNRTENLLWEQAGDIPVVVT